MFHYSPNIVEAKMKFLTAVMKLYLIIWTITPALGIYEKCNRSLGLSELDVDKIDVSTDDEEIQNSRGNIRLSDDWPVFKFPTTGIAVIRIDLGEIYEITGMIIKGEKDNGTAAMDWFKVYYSNHTDKAHWTAYKNEKGEIEKFKGTTKEENIRYQPLHPFRARYIWIRMWEKREIVFGYYAIQIDILGCNITQCNRSLGLSELDVDKIYVDTEIEIIVNSRGNIRLSDDWPVFKYPTTGASLVIIDLGDIYNITGMIIKGEKGNGTAALDVFEVYYSNHTDDGNMIGYVDETGEIEDFSGTTKEENIRYQPLYPFLARYIRIWMLQKLDTDFGYFAIQIDFLGCNIRRPEESD